MVSAPAAHIVFQYGMGKAAHRAFPRNPEAAMKIYQQVRRILDKRPYIIVPDGGLTLATHGYAANMGHAVLLSVDNPKASSGQIYNCGDERTMTLRQIIEVIAKEMNYEWEILDVPNAPAR